MGDRTTVAITIQREDMHAFRAAVEDKWGEPSELDDPIFESDAHQLPVQAVKIWYYDVNYGGITDTEGAARDGLRFVAWHGPGHEYGPYTFYSDGSRVLSWPTTADAYGFVLPHPDAPRFAEEVEQARAFAHGFATIKQQILFGGGLYEPEGTWLHGVPKPAPRGVISRPREALAIVNKHLRMHGALDVGGHRAYLTPQWIDAQIGNECHDCLLIITHGEHRSPRLPTNHSEGQHGRFLCFDKAYDHDCIPQFRALCDELSQSGFSLEEPRPNAYTGIHDFTTRGESL